MTALIVIDLQKDFCTGGALAVPNGEDIVAPINALMSSFDAVILTQDWHPKAHSSFASSHNAAPMSMTNMSYGPQILWPDHCVQGTEGAKFHSDLDINAADLIIRKGYNPLIDSYSAFFENDKTTPTGLEGYLRTRRLQDLTFTGLATDFCVAYSAIDAAKLGFNVHVDLKLTKAIDFDGSYDAALEQMHAEGVNLITS